MLKRCNTLSLQSLRERYERIRMILTLANKGVSYRDISEKLKVDISTISKIVSNNKELKENEENETKE